MNYVNWRIMCTLYGNKEIKILAGLLREIRFCCNTPLKMHVGILCLLLHLSKKNIEFTKHLKK